MNIYYDAEMTELSRNGQLISVGFVSDDGKSWFYAEFNDYGEVSDWVRDNVVSNLVFSENFVRIAYGGICMKGDKEKVAKTLKMWLEDLGEVTINADVLAFDWVFLVDLLGPTAFDIPQNIYYIPVDISTVMLMNGIDPDISREEFIKDSVDECSRICKDWIGNGNKHNSLFDALVAREVDHLIMEVK